MLNPVLLLVLSSSTAFAILPAAASAVPCPTEMVGQYLICTSRDEAEQPGAPGGGGSGGSPGGNGQQPVSRQLPVSERGDQANPGQEFCVQQQTIDPPPRADDPRWGSIDPSQGRVVRCQLGGGTTVGGLQYVEYAVGPNLDPSQPPAAVDPGILAQVAIGRLKLEPVTIGIVPKAATGSDSLGLVGLPVWMWVAEPSSTSFGPASLDVSAGAVSVTMTAQVERIEWSMGDGTVVTCEGPGTSYRSSFGAQESPDCGHTYTTTSKDAGGTFPVTATSYWVAEWSSNTGASGTIEVQQQATEQVRIGESQVIVTSQ